MKKGDFAPELIAPCGMNCWICKRYLTYSKGVLMEKGKVIHCSSCLPRNRNCFIKRGCVRLENEINFCLEFKNMPCENLDRFDRRHRKRYNTNIVANQKELRERSQRISKKSKNMFLLNAVKLFLFTMKNNASVGP